MVWMETDYSKDAHFQWEMAAGATNYGERAPL